MAKARMLGYIKPYTPNSRIDARYRRKVEASRHVADKNKNGGTSNAAKQSKT